MSKLGAGILGLAAALVLSTGSAMAGKANDTLTIATTDWWSTLDPFQFPLDEAAVFYKTIYEPLISYNEYTHKFVPRLAKAWKRIDDKTLEFDLRDDVHFNNGDKFTADDVVATVNLLRDPKVRMRFKDRYDWVASVEKPGPYKVRSLDQTKMVLERNDNYYDKTGPVQAHMKHIVVLNIPDRQTQIA